MSMGGKMTAGWVIFIFVVGGGAYMLMEHPWIFWLAIVSFSIIGIYSFLKK